MIDQSDVVSSGPHTLSVVIPVYQGERTLPSVLAELEHLFEPQLTADGHEYVVAEVLLVHDHGPDGSAATIRQLARQYSQVRPIWLSRNFGQHPATLAGMASAGSDWIVTMDEDGQHDPADIPRFLDVAMRAQATLVYSEPTNQAPHGVLRNTASKATKAIVLRLAGDAGRFQSFRLILGDVGRSIAAYAGPGVFLDIALSWVNPVTAYCPVQLRVEGERPSGYSLRRLLSHFWRLVLTSGTRVLRYVSILGFAIGVIGILMAIQVVVARISGSIDEPGWSSLMVVVLLGTGAVLFTLGVVAEYIGVAVNMAMGRPLYLITSDPASGPLGRRAVQRR